MIDLRAVALALLLAMSAAPASAQDCPGATSNDDCDRIRFEKVDGELTRAVEARLTQIDRRSTLVDKVERAKSTFSAAQRQWLQFREAECRAQAAFEILISARTLNALTAGCLNSLTRRRIEEISR